MQATYILLQKNIFVL